MLEKIIKLVFPVIAAGTLIIPLKAGAEQSRQYLSVGAAYQGLGNGKGDLGEVYPPGLKIGLSYSQDFNNNVGIVLRLSQFSSSASSKNSASTGLLYGKASSESKDLKIYSWDSNVRAIFGNTFMESGFSFQVENYDEYFYSAQRGIFSSGYDREHNVRSQTTYGINGAVGFNIFKDKNPNFSIRFGYSQTSNRDLTVKGVYTGLEANFGLDYTRKKK